MENVKIYEERSDLETEKFQVIGTVFAGWTDDDVAYISKGHIYDGKLEVYIVDEDGELEEDLIDVPYMNDIIEMIEKYKEQVNYNFLAKEAYKSMKKKDHGYYLSRKDLFLAKDGHNFRYEPTEVGGLYRAYEIIDGEEVFIEMALLSTAEYFKFMNEIYKDEA